MKIIFAGTPAFAQIILAGLLNSSHDVVAVYTQPDRKAGRGLKLTASPVKELALQKNIPVLQPETLKNAEVIARLQEFHADVMVVAAYGMLLPAAVLNIPHDGCINVHPSLLPRWRGAAPIQRTIFAGDKISGVTIMKMDVGLDTGPMLLQEKYTLAPLETAQTLHDKLAALSVPLLLKSLDLIAENKAQWLAQDNQKAMYAAKINKAEAKIDWTQPAKSIENKIRAFNPWPVAFTAWGKENLRIWLAQAEEEIDNKLPPGDIVAANKKAITIATGKGVLHLLQVQLPGGKILSAAEFYQAKAQQLIVGGRFA